MKRKHFTFALLVVMLFSCRHEENKQTENLVLVEKPAIVFYYPSTLVEDSLQRAMGSRFFDLRDSLTRFNSEWRHYADSNGLMQVNTTSYRIIFKVQPGYEVNIDTRRWGAPYGIIVFEEGKAPVVLKTQRPPKPQPIATETTGKPQKIARKPKQPMAIPSTQPSVSKAIRQQDSLNFMRRLKARISHLFERKTEFTFTHSEPAFPGAISRKKVVILGLENDIFAGTDMWYTNGTTGEWISPAWQHSPLSRLLHPSRQASLDYYGLQIRQNLYTAKYPFWEGIQYGDRPFAAFITLGNFKISNFPQKRLRLQSSIDIGIIGPHAYGGQVQKFIHSSAKEPVGWENQIRDDVVLKYTLMVEKSLTNIPGHDITADAGMNAGTLYNNAFVGLAYRFARFDRRYRDDLPEAFKPNLWGEVLRKTQIEAFARTWATAVFYDATLQGGIFNHSSPYTIREKDLSRYVLGASGGLSASFNGISIAFSMYMISPEFATFRRWHKWGRIAIGLSF
ncbi:MAG: lipid A deacylase LpxR family protein [Bacteroidales bacterium]|jgi:hypothetical protein|nr:lipid A deacylase LpxR family protein [Bacteroidales bacterium]NPV36883.1 lipid A deacylase LpxR family protein [Bacteroidales bacterium]